MAWNRPSNDGRARTPATPRRTLSVRPTVRGAIVGAVVVLGAGIAAWCFWPKAQPSHEVKSSKPSLIKEAQPAVVSHQVKKPNSDDEFAATNGLKQSDIDKGMRRAKDGHLYMPPPKHREWKRPPHAIFAHRSENAIAALLRIEPGKMVVAQARYDDKFKQDFMKSCEEVIVVNEDDSDYVKSLKRDMIQTKIELRQRMADGEDLGQILSESRRELQKLGQFKNQVERLTKQNIKEGAASEQDAEDLIAAANKMLADKGIAPLKSSALIRKSLLNMTAPSQDDQKKGTENE